MHRAQSCMRAVCIVMAIALMVPAVAAAQSFVYVNNQDTINTISGFAVSPTGALSAVPGSPFATGGIGSTTTCYGLDRMTINTADKLLFVSNSGDQSISVFQMDAAGVLTAAPGSPFPSNLTLDGCGGISLATTPDGKLLMASSNGQIQSFNIAANGALTPAVLTANCCSPTVGMKISPDGKLLALSNETSVSVYTVNADGSLTVVSGSPFAQQATGQLSGLEFSCAADRLYASEASFAASTITDAWSVSAAGALTGVAGSPFLNPGNDANTVLLSPDNRFLFTSDQFVNTVTALSVGASGGLTRIGAYGSPLSLHLPAGLATDAAGQFLFVADDGFGIAVFTINADGSLSNPGDISTIPGQEMQSVAAYPGRSCATSDLSLTIIAGPDPVESGSNVTYTISVTNNGASPADVVVTDNLPAGASFVSCSTSGSGSCTRTFGNPHKFSFSGLAGGNTEIATLVAQTSTDLINGSTLTNTATISNRSVIDTNPANDSATVTVTITALPGPTTLTLAPTAGSFGSFATATATLIKKINGVGVSGKTVSFSVSGVPVGTAVTNSIGQAILHFNATQGIGTYPGVVTATFAGDNVFAASSAIGDLTISQAVLTVFPGAANRVYGDPNPAMTYSITGFLNSDTVSVVSGTASCTTAATVASPVGQYPITCDISGLAAANYTFTSATSLLTITPAPLRIAANSFSRVYGDPNPAFTGSITGLKNSDVVTATYITAASQSSPAGNYAIVPVVVAGPAAGNYSINVVDGTLTITQAPLTVTVTSATRLYGDPNPPFSGTISGLKLADILTATFTTVATPASNVGTYPITPVFNDPFGILGNYAVTIVGGNLTITPAPLSLTINNASRLYGAANPAFSGTFTGLRNGDNITATYSTTATAASPVGTFAIVPAFVDPGVKLGNYTITVTGGVLTITPAPLTIVINNASRVYGNANPAFTGTISGLKNADAITATYSTTATVTSPVGTFSITPTFNDPGAKLGNYTVTITNGVLTITTAPLTVSAIGGSRVYGDPNPAASFVGLKNGDNITATYTTPTAASPIGTYTLTPILVDPTGKLGNYSVTIKTAVLTISKAPLTVTAANATRAYGSANPAFSETITGIKNGDNITANPTTTATPSTTAGTAVITAGLNDPTAKLGNYNVTANNGTLTITKVALTIAANNATVTLSTTTPGFTATYTGFVNGETSANLAGTLNCSASLGTVGSHPITCSGQSSNNYTITFVGGTATVDYAPVGSCTAGPGHQILGTTTFPRATTTSIPVQFRVCDARGTAISSTVVSSFTLLQKITGGVTTTLNQAQTAAFAFNGTNQDWIATLSTSTPTNLAAGSTYVYQIGLNDGTSITFQLSMN